MILSYPSYKTERSKTELGHFLCALSRDQASSEAVLSNSGTTAKSVRVQEARSRSKGAVGVTASSNGLGLERIVSKCSQVRVAKDVRWS